MTSGDGIRVFSKRGDFYSALEPLFVQRCFSAPSYPISKRFPPTPKQLKRFFPECSGAKVTRIQSNVGKPRGSLKSHSCKSSPVAGRGKNGLGPVSRRRRGIAYDHSRSYSSRSLSVSDSEVAPLKKIWNIEPNGSSTRPYFSSIRFRSGSAPDLWNEIHESQRRMRRTSEPSAKHKATTAKTVSEPRDVNIRNGLTRI
ncbi:hypothetical protein AAMO2058_000750400 [Amorphochlora amoebiformis]